MIITYHREKLVNAVIYFSKKTKYCGITKLMKLLYFLDFSHFKQTGKSVTGQDYFAWEKGPVPKKVYEELTNGLKPDMKRAIQNLPSGEFKKIQAKAQFDPKYFSNREINLLDQISFMFGDAKAEDMVESTHLKNEPWDRTKKTKGLYSPIDYMMAIDSDKLSLSFDEAKERMEERKEVFDLFGAH